MESELPESDLPETLAATNAADLQLEQPMAPEAALPPEKLTSFGLALEAVLVATALLVAWLTGFFDLARPLNQWFSGNWVGEIAIGSLLSIPLLLIVLLLLPQWKPLKPFFDLVDDKIAPLFLPLNRWQVGLISLSAGVGEELLFRWCLQGGLAENFGLPVALIGASLVFGLMHFLNFTYFALISVLGVILGLIYWYFGPLAAIACHAMYDFLAILYLQKTSSKDDQSPTGA